MAIAPQNHGHLIQAWICGSKHDALWKLLSREPRANYPSFVPKLPQSNVDGWSIARTPPSPVGELGENLIRSAPCCALGSRHSKFFGPLGQGRWGHALSFGLVLELVPGIGHLRTSNLATLTSPKLLSSRATPLSLAATISATRRQGFPPSPHCKSPTCAPYSRTYSYRHHSKKWSAQRMLSPTVEAYSFMKIPHHRMRCHHQCLSLLKPDCEDKLWLKEAHAPDDVDLLSRSNLCSSALSPIVSSVLTMWPVWLSANFRPQRSLYDVIIIRRLRFFPLSFHLASFSFRPMLWFYEGSNLKLVGPTVRHRSHQRPSMQPLSPWKECNRFHSCFHLMHPELLTSGCSQGSAPSRLQIHLHHRYLIHYWSILCHELLQLSRPHFKPKSSRNLKKACPFKGLVRIHQLPALCASGESTATFQLELQSFLVELLWGWLSPQTSTDVQPANPKETVDTEVFVHQDAVRPMAIASGCNFLQGSGPWWISSASPLQLHIVHWIVWRSTRERGEDVPVQRPSLGFCGWELFITVWVKTISRKTQAA